MHQPPTRTERVQGFVNGQPMTLVRLVHDGPCVFVDHQCSCGLLDIGIVRDDSGESLASFSERWSAVNRAVNG